MTIAEASKEFKIPSSRIRGAIKKGWLAAEMVGRRYEFSRSDFLKAIGIVAHVTRLTELSFHVIVTDDFLIEGKDDHKFDTRSAADEFERSMDVEAPESELTVTLERLEEPELFPEPKRTSKSEQGRMCRV